MAQQFEADSGLFITEDGPEKAHDVNKVIRSNLSFLRRQLLQDTVEARWIAEHGEVWIEKFEKSTGIREIAEDAYLYRTLESFIAQELEVDGWHFQDPENLSIPMASRKKISAGTGISEGRLTNIDQELTEYPSGASEGGQPMTVEELIRLATFFDVTVSYLLTPPSNFIKKQQCLRLPLTNAVPNREISTANWILWLHNLLPLPQQDWVRFERNLSYPSLSVEPLPKNSTPEKAVVRRTVIETRKSRVSLIRSLNDYSPLKGKVQNPTDGLKEPSMKETRLNDNIIFQNRGLFVELRKGIRAVTRQEQPSSYLKKILHTAKKVKNFYFGTARYLRAQDSRTANR